MHYSPAYYGGHYNTSNINQNLLTKIEITQIKELEQRSLDLVHSWEASLEAGITNS